MTDRASVPTSTNDACSAVSPRKRVISPIDSTPTIGQNSSSKKKKTFRMPMSALRTTTAQAASSSARQFNEDLLQLGLAHLEIPDLHALGQQRAQELGHALLGGVHRALDPAAGLASAQHPGHLAEPRRPWLQPQRDHVTEADLTLERLGRAVGQDPPALDEADLVAQLVGFPHVVRGEHDRHPLLATEVGN